MAVRYAARVHVIGHALVNMHVRMLQVAKCCLLTSTLDMQRSRCMNIYDRRCTHKTARLTVTPLYLLSCCVVLSVLPVH